MGIFLAASLPWTCGARSRLSRSSTLTLEDAHAASITREGELARAARIDY